MQFQNIAITKIKHILNYWCPQRLFMGIADMHFLPY